MVPTILKVVENVDFQYPEGPRTCYTIPAGLTLSVGEASYACKGGAASLTTGFPRRGNGVFTSAPRWAPLRGSGRG